MSAALRGLRAGLRARLRARLRRLASNFVDLAHQKIKPGGVLALVLPLTVVSGGSAWSARREVLARWYRDIAVIALATTGSEDRAFSADTGMAEALVLAVKRGKPIEASPEPRPRSSSTSFGALATPRSRLRESRGADAKASPTDA